LTDIIQILQCSSYGLMTEKNFRKIGEGDLTTF